MPLTQQERQRRSAVLQQYAGQDLDLDSLESILADSEHLDSATFDSQFSQGKEPEKQSRNVRTFSPTMPQGTRATPQPMAQPAAKYGEYSQATTHAPRTDPDANSITDFFSGTQQGGVRGRRQRIAPEAYKMEVSMLARNVDAFEELRGSLNNDYERMDQPARAQFTEIQKRSEAVQRSFTNGRLNQLEYLRAMDTIAQQATRYKWEYHKIAPGGQLGDQVEVDGVVKTRTAHGLEPTAYTPDFIKQNTIPIGRGKLAVPVGPGRPYQIVDEETYDRDVSKENELLEKMDRAIDHQFSREVEVWQKGHTKKDLITGEMSIPDVPPEILESLMERATNNTIERYKRAKHATKQILDGGNRPDTPEAIQGDTEDPTVTRRIGRQKDAQERATFDRDLANLFAQPGKDLYQGQSVDPTDAGVAEQVRNAKTPEEVTEAQVSDWRNDPIIAFRYNNPVVVKNRGDLNSVKDGEVVMKPDGTKALKKNGRFYPLQ